jgi:hypothetical protein
VTPDVDDVLGTVVASLRSGVETCGRRAVIVNGGDMGTVLLVILVLLLVGALPTWPYSGGWGYYPSGGLGLVLLIVLILLVMGRI